MRKMFANEVHIRIAEQGLAFVYSVRRDGKEIATGVILVEEEVAPGDGLGRMKKPRYPVARARGSVSLDCGEV